MEELLKKLFAPKPTSNMSGFQFADLLNNDRWRTAQRESFNPNRGEMVDYRQYVPREPYADPSVLADTDPNKGMAASFTLPIVSGNPMFHAGNNPYDNHPSNYQRNEGTTVKKTTDNNGGVTTTETTKFLPMMPIDNSRNFTPMSPIDNSRNFNPMMPIDQRTSATTYPLQYSNQSQLNRFPEGISPVEGMTDAMKRRMLELFFRGNGMRLTRND